LLFNAQLNNVSAISWREQVTVDDMLNNVRFVQVQHS